MVIPQNTEDDMSNAQQKITEGIRVLKGEDSRIGVERLTKIEYAVKQALGEEGWTQFLQHAQHTKRRESGFGAGV